MNFFDKLKQIVSAKQPVIVFPEGTSERILTAASKLKADKIMNPLVLGKADEIKKLADEKNIDISHLDTLDAEKYEDIDKLVDMFVERRKGKITAEDARKKLLTDTNYFGTMLVYSGKADCMVSGAVHTTGDTVRPALQIIKVKPGHSRVSGLFIMVKGEKIYLVADGAININPDAQAIAEITETTVDTARSIGMEPRVAMLSFSTHGSANSEETEKMAEATRLVREKMPELIVDGEIQFDAAFVPEIADRKAPGSPLKGNANVFIFPCLDAGNIGYKLIQRFGGYDAIGPVLQGLNMPVSDLSRGCTAEEAYNLALFTAATAIAGK